MGCLDLGSPLFLYILKLNFSNNNNNLKKSKK